MFKKIKCTNVWFIIFSLLVIGFAINETINPTNTQVSLFNYIPVVFGIPMIVIGTLALGYEIYYLCARTNKKELLNKIKNITFMVITSILTIYFVEYVILGVVRTFIEASELNKIPVKGDNFWVSVAYIIIHKGLDYIKGIGVTLSISLLGTLIGLVLAFVLALLRTIKVNAKDNEFKLFIKKVAINISKAYIAVFRGTPMMVQAILIFYLIPFVISQSTGIPMTTMNKIFTWFVSGLITVSLNTTAYLAEVLRGSIESLDKGQMEAARSLGMSYPQAMINVILPQALKNSIPAIGNEFVINIKDTSVLNVIWVVDIFFVAAAVNKEYSRFEEPFLIAAIIYLVLTLSLTKLLSLIEKKLDVEEKPLPSAN